MAEITKAELQLWVYDGAIDSHTEDPQYTLTKSVIGEEETVTFEISELVKDYIEIDFNGDYDSLKQSRWVKARITRTYDNDTTDNYSRHYIAYRGYGELVDGINPELSKDLMISNTVIQTRCNYPISAPFYTGTGGTTKVKYIQDQTELDSQILGTSEIYSIAQDVKVNPPSDNVVTIDKTLSETSDANAANSVDEFPAGTNKITYTTQDNVERSILIKCIDECDYKGDPYKISFINKFGVMQDIWFFGRRTDSISAKRESYKKAILKTGQGAASYDISDHQNVYLENQGKESFSLHTGYIDESYNEVIKQLIVSEYVYIHDELRRSPTNGFYDLALPISVVSGSLQIKTRRDDKLISYELEFESDSEFIQSVR